MSIITPEIAAKITEYRARSLTGELSLEEMREAIVLVRNGRLGAAQAAAAAGKRPSTKKIAASEESLLEGLEGLGA